MTELMQNPPPVSDYVMRQRLDHATALAATLVSDARGREKIIAQIVTQSKISQEAATQIVDAAFAKHARRRKWLGVGEMVAGAVMVIGGLAVTLFTGAAAAASPTGGVYVVCGGVILAGAGMFLNGISAAFD